MKSKLDYIEHKLQKIFEGSDFVFPWGDNRQILIRKLVEALHDSVDEHDGESLTASNVYTVQIPPQDYSNWQIKDETIKMFTLALQDAASEVGVHFNTRPVIRFEINSSDNPNELLISTSELSESREITTFIATENADLNEDQNLRPQNAFLIINENENFPLDKTVISIGRRKNNQLVLENPHISRVHAQIRVSQNHFVLFDLDTTGGTYVNGQRITRHILRPGDVISLAGVPIIYGEETPLHEDTPIENSIGDTKKVSDLLEENESSHLKREQ
jgi:hypothetical protein